MYEIFDHTADLGLRIKAADLNTLFADAGRGLFSVIVANLDDARPVVSESLSVDGTDREYLLFDWLSELLYLWESRRLVICKFDVKVGARGLQAQLSGEPLDEARHRLDHEVKAITYHGLKVEQIGDQWLAEVIVDI